MLTDVNSFAHFIKNLTCSNLVQNLRKTYYYYYINIRERNFLLSGGTSFKFAFSVADCFFELFFFFFYLKLSTRIRRLFQPIDLIQFLCSGCKYSICRFNLSLSDSP